MKQWNVLLLGCWLFTAYAVPPQQAPDQWITKRVAITNNIDSISIPAPISVQITAGSVSNQDIVITGPRKLVESISTATHGNNLTLYSIHTLINQRDRQIAINVSINHLTHLHYSNLAQIQVKDLDHSPLYIQAVDGDLQMNGHVNLQNLVTTGKGHIEINNISTPHLTVTDFGKTQINLNGENVGLDRVNHFGDSNIEINGVARNPLTVLLRNEAGSTNLHGRAVNLRIVDALSPVNFTLNAISSPDLTVISSGSGALTLRGNANLRLLSHSGTGMVTINGAYSDGLTVFAEGHGSMYINGRDIELQNLHITHNEYILMSGINSDALNVSGLELSKIHLAGHANAMNAEIKDHSLFDGFYLAVNRSYVRTTDDAQANISPVDYFDAQAGEGSNIYYFEQPQFIAPMMETSGSVLPMFHAAPPYPIDWSHAQEYWAQR